MNELEWALDNVARQLARQHRPVLDRLQNGLSPDAARRFLRTAPFEVLDDLVTLYAWRNGTRIRSGELLESLYLFPGFIFVSIDEMIRMYEGLNRCHSQWRPSWLPVCKDEAGDYYAVELADEVFRRGQVIEFLHGEPEQCVRYESLLTMMQTIAACYDEGVYFIASDGRIDQDWDGYASIVKRFNPNIEFLD